VGCWPAALTDPPALAFAHAISTFDAPLLACAPVYPFSMLLRILTAQILLVILCG
jgi:putative transport protein